jgi:hypothetical protein
MLKFIVIVAALITILILLLFKSDVKSKGNVLKKDYEFEQGMDIEGNNIFEDLSLADDIPALKEACNVYPNKSCRGFNTDGQFKVSAHADQLIEWDEAINDPKRGFYTRNMK